MYREWKPGMEYQGQRRIVRRSGKLEVCYRCKSSNSRMMLLYARNGVPTPKVICLLCGADSGGVKLAEVPNWRALGIYRDNRGRFGNRCRICGSIENERCSKYGVYLCRDCHYFAHYEYRMVRDKIGARRISEETDMSNCLAWERFE